MIDPNQRFPTILDVTTTINFWLGSADYMRCFGNRSVYLWTSSLPNLVVPEDFYYSTRGLQYSVLDGVGLSDYKRTANVFYRTKLLIPFLSATVFPFSFSVGWCCGAWVFGLIGLSIALPRSSIADIFFSNNNYNNYKYQQTSKQTNKIFRRFSCLWWQIKYIQICVTLALPQNKTKQYDEVSWK